MLIVLVNDKNILMWTIFEANVVSKKLRYLLGRSLNFFSYQMNSENNLLVFVIFWPNLGMETVSCPPLQHRE